MDTKEIQAQRAAVVREALSWVGTPYHHEADVKGSGVDCGMLLVRCFVDTGIVEPFDPRPYAKDWHLHQTEERYLGFVLSRSTERAPNEAPEAGDVIVWRHGRCFSHGGIITAFPSFIHAYANARMVLHDTLNGTVFAEKPYRIFNPWGNA